MRIKRRKRNAPDGTELPTQMMETLPAELPTEMSDATLPTEMPTQRLEAPVESPPVETLRTKLLIDISSEPEAETERIRAFPPAKEVATLQPARMWQVSIMVIVTIVTAVVTSVLLVAPAKVPARLLPPITQATAPIAVSTAPPLPALALHGTQLVDRAGRPTTLIGAARSSLEYDCHGDGHFSPADFQAMRAWGMNTVRITLSSEYWANAGGSCPDYHQTVIQAVANAEATGLYVILTLQWNAPFDTPHDRLHGGVQCPMPDNRQDVAFWHDLATIYRNDQRILFDLFSEPHDISWDAWLHGGEIPDALCYIISRTGGTETGAYQAIGMRDLANIVRAIAPHNILIISGTDWGYDLAELARYAIGGANIIYSTHPFDYSGKQPENWPTDFGSVIGSFPVIAGEFGSYTCGTSYVSQAISYFNAHHLSWLAWAWSPNGCGGPGLLADWSGTPSAPYGTYIRQQMQAQAKRDASPHGDGDGHGKGNGNTGNQGGNGQQGNNGNNGNNANNGNNGNNGNNADKGNGSGKADGA